MALSHGVPILVCGATEDKPEVAARVAWSGAGLRVRDAQPAPGPIKSAVRRLLDDPSYASNARRIGDDIAGYDSAGIASELIEQLARTGQPVLRGGSRPLGATFTQSSPARRAEPLRMD
jgi:UDP:flavonoid glycosyltransferase YjiC (YdhE family)